jgi:hypothetical protein
MRSIDDQMNEITKRSRKIQRKQKNHRLIITDTIGACACLALLVGVASGISNIEIGSWDAAGSIYGSLLLSAPAAGYVTIGVLGFLLGICITLLCLHLHRQRRDGEDD